MSSKEIKKSVTTKSTKNEIKEALNNALEELKNYEKSFDPEKEKEQQSRKEMLDNAESVVSSKSIDISDTVDILVNTYDEIKKNIQISKEEYQSLCDAVHLKNKEIKDLYDVEVNLEKLSNLFQLQADKKLQLDQEIEGYETYITKQKEQLLKDYKEYRNALEKENKRKEEELNYSFERMSKIQNDELNDRKTATEDEINKLRLKWSEEFSQLTDLQDRVNGIQEEIKVAVDAAVEETKNKMEESNTYAKTIIRKDLTNEISVLNSKLEQVTSNTYKLEEENKNLKIKLEDAYKEIKNIATTSMESKATYDEIERLKEIALKQNKDTK